MYVCGDEANTYVICLSRNFLEVAGSLVEQSIEPRVLQHLLSLLLQKPHLRRTKTDDSSPWAKKRRSYLLCDDCQLASCSGTRELVSLLNLGVRIVMSGKYSIIHIKCVTTMMREKGKI